VSTVQLFRQDPAVRAGLLYRYFLPGCISSDPETAPFLSLLRLRPIENPSVPPAPISDAHVCFYRFQIGSEQLSDRDVRAHLKWEPDMNGERYSFLAQMTLHAMAEAFYGGATDVSLGASYPSAFSATMESQLRSTWENICALMPGLTGVKCQLQPPETESVASAYHFMNRLHGMPGVGMVVVDIGGGTTDISIWKEMKLLLQSSIRLSGRQTLLEPSSVAIARWWPPCVSRSLPSNKGPLLLR